MQWNEELEQLAILNVKQCAKVYDPCHNTLEFRNSGQSVALQNISIAVEATDEELIKDNIDRWWEQHKNITKERVEFYPKEPKISEYVHSILGNDSSYQSHF